MTNVATLPPREDGFVRKKWSVKECRFLTDSGLLEPGKYELIEGEVVFKMGQGRKHIYVVAQIIAILTAIFGDAVQTQAEIGVGEIDDFNDPEPDVTVLRGTLRDYLDREPDPSTDVVLAVEAAQTSLRGDTTTKAQLYALHGVPEYWVVAIARRELIVYRQPTADGYAAVQTFSETESVAPLAAPESPFKVAAAYKRLAAGPTAQN